MNLLLLGRAHSNVFDGQRVLSDGDGGAKRGTAEGEGGGGGGDRVVLQGAPCRGRVGFLTLFEAYKHVEVGGATHFPLSGNIQEIFYFNCNVQIVLMVPNRVVRR